jgi:hypothetical protein
VRLLRFEQFLLTPVDTCRVTAVETLRTSGFAEVVPTPIHEGVDAIAEARHQRSVDSEPCGERDGPMEFVVPQWDRGEQAVLRKAVLGTAPTAECALCGKTYPTSLLRAAHIKPRSVCSDDERRDLASIAMPACLLGCDALFEDGYVSVDAAGLVTSSGEHDLPQALADRVAELVDRQCGAFDQGSADYFEWHRINRLRVE